MRAASWSSTRTIAIERELVAAATAVGVAVDPAQVQPFDVQRDSLWPKSVVTWLDPVGHLPAALRPGRFADASLATSRRRARVTPSARRMTRRVPPPARSRRASSPSSRRRRRSRPDPRAASCPRAARPRRLESLAHTLVPHRRRLWLRRIVRRAWIALAVLVVAEPCFGRRAVSSRSMGPRHRGRPSRSGTPGVARRRVRPARPLVRPPSRSTPKAASVTGSSALESRSAFPASADTG